MFPDDTNDLNFDDEKELKKYDGIVYLFDFEKNEFVVQDGKLIELSKLDSIKQFAIWTIKTQINKYRIYKDYGIDRDLLIGSKSLPSTFKNTEFKRNVIEQLTKNPFILRIDNFTFVKERTTLKVSFDIITSEGNLSLNEVI